MIFYSCVKSNQWLLTNRLLLIMKLAVFLTLLTVLQATAGSMAQTVTLAAKNEPLPEVMEKIKRQTDYHFFLTGKQLAEIRVNTTLRNAKLADAMDALTRGVGVEWLIEDKVIILRSASESPRSVPPAVNLPTVQERVITGKVTDDGGLPLPGVTVAAKGTSAAAVTDTDGSYRLVIPTGANTLTFSMIGFEPTESTIGAQQVINIMLQASVSDLDEVVVVGYGTQRKGDLTGAVASANLEAFSESPNVNVLQSLQGSLPGVQIGQTNQAGETPGISVRGRTTLSGNMDVLVVVDGIIYRGGLYHINPSDIKSIEILKDASSKAIYGAQAANGVLLITTKEGRSASKNTLTYNTFAALQTPTVRASLLGPEEFLRKVKDIDYLKAYLAPDYIQDNPDWDYAQSALRAFQLEGINNGANNDWWKEATTASYSYNNNVSVAGNNENSSYFISGNLVKQQGIIKGDVYKRSSLRVNLETNISEWLKIGVNSFGSFNDYSGRPPTLSRIAYTSPFGGWEDENGNFIIDHQYNGTVNPFIEMRNDDFYHENNISGNLYMILDVPQVKGLTYRINYNNNYRWYRKFESNAYAANQQGVAYKTNDANYDMMLDNIVSYERNIFGDHRIDLTGVIGFNKLENEATTARGEMYSDLGLSYNNLQEAGIQKTSSDGWRESYTYQMIRLGYNVKSRYVLNATLRRDGFSGFASNKKIALFPSVGVAWHISEEPFFKVDQVDYLKLRGSFGQNGNLTGRYSSLARIATDPRFSYVFGDGGQTVLNQYPSSMANDDLSWERTQEINVGLEFASFRNRLNVTLDYYNTTTKDLLWNLSIPTMTGFSSVRSNVGEINNKGLELLVSGKVLDYKQLQWKLDVGFSRNKNKIVKLLGIDANQDGREDDLIASGLFIGHSIGSVYSYQIDGIWQLSDQVPTGYFPGTYRIVDQNGDGNISAANDRVILGQSEPAYRFSVQSTLSYGDWSFKFFINSIQGGKNGYLQANDAFRSTPGNMQNLNWYNFVDYWSPSTPNSEYEAGWLSPAIRASKYQSRSFTRLQDVSISYTLPSKITERIMIGDLKVFVSGKNLLTFTKWEGWDPETGQGVYTADAFPVYKSYAIGLDLTF